MALSTAEKRALYIRLAKEIAEEYNLAGVMLRHNQSLSESSPAYANPLDNNTSFGPLKEVSALNKAGYGALITVQNKRERDRVLEKFWDVLESNAEEIRSKYVEAFLEHEELVDVLDLSFVRNTKFSEGCKTIFLRLFEMKKDGTPKGDPTDAFVLAAKGLRGTSKDPHELMTATLISMNRIVNYNRINSLPVVERSTALEELITEVYANHRNVIGHKQDEANAMEGDTGNLARAISVSNYVVGLCRRNGATIERVYQTGKAWHRDLTARNRNFRGSDPAKDLLIKDYNSADLIVRINHHGVIHHWGLSLKKKKAINDDPTLLNKPLIGDASASGKQKAGYLYLRAQGNERQQMIAAEDNFWKQVYMQKFSEGATFPRGKKLGDNVPPSNFNGDRNWKSQLNDVLSDTEKNAALTGKEFRGVRYPRNFFFEKLDEVFRRIMSQPDNFREFLDLAFRFDIDDYVRQEHFHFSLITGSGRLLPDGKIQVRPAEEKSSALLKEVFNTLMQGGTSNISNPSALTRAPNLILEQTQGEIHAFQSNATAAKLFYTMKIDNLPIVRLEARYKGTITASPQFQVFITVDFKHYLHNIRRTLRRLGIHAFLTR